MYFDEIVKRIDSLLGTLFDKIVNDFDSDNNIDIVSLFISVPSNKILYWSKLKAFVADVSNSAAVMVMVHL